MSALVSHAEAGESVSPAALSDEEVEQFSAMYRRLRTLAEAADAGTYSEVSEGMN